VTDHDIHAAHQSRLQLLARRTLSLAVGRGMFTLGLATPLPTGSVLLVYQTGTLLLVYQPLHLVSLHRCRQVAVATSTRRLAVVYAGSY
jgi:hypothetical protein